jgi:pSer/pThr/pTyr-binding forkhead associated (FHA) protein
VTVAAGRATPDVGALWLRVDEPSDGSTVVGLVDEALIGRDYRCDVVVHDDEASRMHARVAPTDAGWVIRDLDTTNGTFVNGARIVGPATIGPGDVIGVGRITCSVIQPPSS